MIAFPMNAEDAARIISAMWPERGREMRRALYREHGPDLSEIDFPFAFRMCAEKNGENTKVVFSACIDGRKLESVREESFPGWPAKELCDKCLGVACAANANLGHEGMRSVAMAGTDDLDIWRLRSVVKTMMMTGAFSNGIAAASTMLTGAAMGAAVFPVGAVIGGLMSGRKLWKMAKNFHETFKEELGRLRAASAARDIIPDERQIGDSEMTINPQAIADRAVATLGPDGISAVHDFVENPLAQLFPKATEIAEKAAKVVKEAKSVIKATMTTFNMLVREIRSEEIIGGIVDHGIRLAGEPRPGERARQDQRGPRA